MLPAERLVNMSTRARRYTTQAHVLACLQVVFHSASCQRTTLLHRQRKSSSTLYLTLLVCVNGVFLPVVLLPRRRMCGKFAAMESCEPNRVLYLTVLAAVLARGDAAFPLEEFGKVALVPESGLGGDFRDELLGRLQ